MADGWRGLMIDGGGKVQVAAAGVRLRQVSGAECTMTVELRIRSGGE